MTGARLLPPVLALAGAVVLGGCQHQQWVVTAVNPDGTSGGQNVVICKPADADQVRRAYQVTAQQAGRATVGGRCPEGRLLWEMSE